MKPDILTFTNGFHGTRPGIEFAAWMGASMQAPVTLVGVVEQVDSAQIDKKHPLEEIFATAVALFEERGVAYTLEVDNGHAEDVIIKKAREKNYLTVLTPLGRPPLQRLMVGSSFRHFMAELSTPLLFVPAARIPVRKVLICVGGLGYELTAEHLGLRVAAMNRAEVTLLHIVPPGDLEYPTARALRDNWQHAADTDTPIGRSLRAGLEAARSMGLAALVHSRSGPVADEILDEISQGGYDIVCMGSAYSAHSLRHLYTPNITAEVAEAGLCPVLTARSDARAQGAQPA